jgi:uncharacterized protein YlxW (UPF0749 family)
MNTMELNPALTETAKADLGAKNARRNWWATLFLLCAILGAMLGLSVRTQQVVRQTSTATDSTISRKQVEDQQRTIAALQERINKYEAGVSSSSAQTRAMSDDLKSAKFLAGLTAVKGQGIIVTLNDSKMPYSKDIPPGFVPQNIIHDTDINQTVNELKTAGAEAISVNDQRLIATSPIRCAGPTVYINNTMAAPPFVIKAIGDAKTLQAALNISGGEEEQINHFDPAMMKTQISSHLLIPAYSGVIQPKYALPVTGVTSDKKPGV